MRKKVAENSPAIWCLRYVGLWYPNNENSLFYKLYGIYSTLSFVIYISHVTAMVIHVCLICRDIETFAASTYVLSIKVMGAYKRIYLRSGMSLARKLIYLLDEERFQPKDSNQEAIEKQLYSEWKLRTNALVYGVVLTVIFLVISPFIDGITKMKLPFEAWYPLVPEKPNVVLYAILYVFQALGTMYAGCVNVGTDVFVSQILNNITIQCNLVSHTAEHLYEYSEKNLESPCPSTKEVLGNMDSTLVLCMKQHKAILEYSKEVEAFFNLGLIGQFVACCMIICMNMLRLSLLNEQGGEFLALLVYHLIICTTLLTYCWHGNEVSASSEMIPISAYKCPWFECDVKFQKNLQFFILRTQKSISILTLNFFPVSLAVYIFIMRSSYSFYAVLRSSHEAN